MIRDPIRWGANRVSEGTPGKAATSWRTATLLCLLVLASSGCDGPERRGEPAPGIALQEGPDTLGLRRFVSPPGFEPAFSTYLPPDVQPERPEVATGRNDVIRFISHTGGVRHDSAFVQVHVWPEGYSRDHVDEVVRTAAERVRIPGDRSELEPVRRHSWATLEYDIRSQGTLLEPVVGWVALGRQNGRWFHVIAQAPERLHRTFLPQAERILDRWRWESTGEGLGGAAPLPGG